MTKEQRRARDKALKERLKGIWAHISSRIVEGPVNGIDPVFDRGIETGQYRDVVPAAVIAEVIRVDLEGMPEQRTPLAARRARTKGLTYRRYPLGRTRREWREIERML